MMSGLCSSFMREWLVTGMPSPMLKSIKIIANKTPPGLLLVGRYPLFRTSHGVCLLVVGEYKLYHSVREPPIMYLVWKIPRSLGCYVDNESIPLEIIYLYFKIELQHLCKSLLPFAQGLSFTFMQEAIIFLLIPTYSLVGKHHVMERSKHICPFKYI